MATITIVKERINQLNQADFHILCDAFLAKEGSPDIVALGKKMVKRKLLPELLILIFA